MSFQNIGDRKMRPAATSRTLREDEALRDIEALLTAPSRSAPVKRVPRRARSGWLAPAVAALLVLGGGSAVTLAVSTVPGCGGPACMNPPTRAPRVTVAQAPEAEVPAGAGDDASPQVVQGRSVTEPRALPAGLRRSAPLGARLPAAAARSTGRPHAIRRAAAHAPRARLLVPSGASLGARLPRAHGRPEVARNAATVRRLQHAGPTPMTPARLAVARSHLRH